MCKPFRSQGILQGEYLPLKHRLRYSRERAQNLGYEGRNITLKVTFLKTRTFTHYVQPRTSCSPWRPCSRCCRSRILELAMSRSGQLSTCRESSARNHWLALTWGGTDERMDSDHLRASRSSFSAVSTPILAGNYSLESS